MSRDRVLRGVATGLSAWTGGGDGLDQREPLPVSDLWFALLAVALFAVLLGVLAPVDGASAPVGLIRICQAPDAPLPAASAPDRVRLPAGAQFLLAPGAVGPVEHLEVIIDEPVSLSLSRGACVTVVARQLVAPRVLTVGETLQPRWAMPGLKAQVTVVSDFE